MKQDCVAGFHLPFRQLEVLRECELYIPAKHDWLLLPHATVDWLPYTTAATHIGELVQNGRSPLVWLRRSDGRLERCFTTFCQGVLPCHLPLPLHLRPRPSTSYLKRKIWARLTELAFMLSEVEVQVQGDGGTQGCVQNGAALI